MIQNYLQIIWGYLAKNRLFTTINITGLSIAIASALYLLVYVIHESSYDTFHENASRIYRVSYIHGAEEKTNSSKVCPPLAYTLEQEYPEVEYAVRVSSYEKSNIFVDYKDFYEEKIIYADSTFFNLFSFKFIAGSKSTALSLPYSAVLTESLAVKFFGNKDPVNQVITIGDEKNLYRITGVIQDLPTNSHIKCNMIVSFSSRPDHKLNWWLSAEFHTYVMLKNGTNPKLFERHFDDITMRYVAPQLEITVNVGISKPSDWGYFYLEPIKRIHLYSEVVDGLEPNGNSKLIVAFLIIAILILFLASINYINLSTAVSVNRGKEIGILKVLGAEKKTISIYFLLETMFFVFISIILSCCLLLLFVPSLNRYLNMDFGITNFLNWGLFGLLSGIFFIVSILSGIYPALIAASYNPVKALKGNLSDKKGGGNTRTVLVGIQVLITAFVLTSSLLVYEQINYIQKRDLGFDKEHIVVISQANALKDNQESFMQEIKKFPQITDATFTSQIPCIDIVNSETFLEGKDVSTNMFQFYADEEFVNVFNFQILSGREFSKEMTTDKNAVIINEAAVRSLKLTNPIGKLLNPAPSEDWFEIIGTCKDFNFKSLHYHVEPAMVFMNKGIHKYLCLKVKFRDFSSSINFVKGKWKDFINKDVPFNYFFLNEKINHLYQQEQITKRLLFVFFIMIIGITFLGIYGLVTYTTLKRRKDVAVYKVLGAETYYIIIKYVKEIQIIILVSCVLSVPVSYFLIKEWLQNFAYQINITMFSFLITWVIISVVALISTIFQIVSAANIKPAKVLNNE
ncbi:MAG: ABC transporter permease [Bacteroidales bacterium]|jgi:putative ABC transport system permease protein|nr:ABC transporter permease [Bacteroidales bacterium]